MKRELRVLSFNDLAAESVPIHLLSTSCRVGENNDPSASRENSSCLLFADLQDGFRNLPATHKLRRIEFVITKALMLAARRNYRLGLAMRRDSELDACGAARDRGRRFTALLRYILKRQHERHKRPKKQETDQRLAA